MKASVLPGLFRWETWTAELVHVALLVSKHQLDPITGFIAARPMNANNLDGDSSARRVAK